MHILANLKGLGSAMVLAALVGTQTGCDRNTPETPAGAGSSAAAAMETAGEPSASAKTVTLTKDNFQQEVISSKVPVMVDFWAEWCGPCKLLEPTVAALADEYEGKLKVGKVDVDRENSLSETYDIQSIPALLFFKEGKLVHKIVGLRSKQELRGELDKLIASSAAASN